MRQMMRCASCVLLALATATCRESPVGLRGSGGNRLVMRIAPQLSAEARVGLQTLAAASGSLGNLHIHVSHPPAAPLDTIVPFPAGADSATFTLSVLLVSSTEQLAITLTLSVGSTVYYSGNQQVTATEGVGAVAPPIVMSYVGPSVTITVAPDSVALHPGDTLRVVATPRDLAGHPIAGHTLTFASSDTTIATVSSTGLVTGLILGQVQVTATSDQASSISHLQVTPQPRDAISAGLESACALTDGGQAYCWGWNAHGQVGDGTTTNRNVPTAIGGTLRFTQISSGQLVSCAVSAQRAAYCWGDITKGGFSLGDGSTSPSLVPVAVSGGLKFKTVKVSQGAFACGITISGATYCWGMNDAGGPASNTLGTGDTQSRSVPTLVVGSLSFTALALGDGHACGLTTSGSAYCWGGEYDGEIGQGTIGTGSLVPKPVATALRFTDITAGDRETCAVAVGGAAYCWGLDQAGSRGAGPATGVADASTPFAVTGGLAFSSIGLGDATGGTHGCGLTPAGQVYCWGSNLAGQLGTTATISSCPFGGSSTQSCTGSPVQVAGGNTFTAISVGIINTCGITTSHTLLCWGGNALDQLGNGTTVPSSTPTPVSGNLRTP